MRKSRVQYNHLGPRQRVYENQVLFVRMKVTFQDSKNRGTQVPILILQSSSTIMWDVGFCSPRQISAHFHVEGGPIFCHMSGFTVFTTTWNCSLTIGA